MTRGGKFKSKWRVRRRRWYLLKYTNWPKRRRMTIPKKLKLLIIPYIFYHMI
tara:strand:- start:2128 stop:2283 length:156 start_codon:yes stop_codon:yes gene_type:complete